MIDAIPPEALLHRPAIVRAVNFYFGPGGPVPLVAAQIMQESGYDAAARSRTGALGLMQFMPATAQWVGQSIGSGNAADPKWAIPAGVWYDRWLYDRVRYDREADRWGATLSAYNGGLGWHNKRRALAADREDFWTSVRLANPGITAANQRENERYPEQIMRRWQPLFAAWGRVI